MLRRKEFRKKIKKIEFKLCPECHNNYKAGKIVFDKGFKVKKAYTIKVCDLGCGKNEIKGKLIQNPGLIEPNSPGAKEKKHCLIG